MASELEAAYLAYTEAAAKAEQKKTRYKIALARAVGRAITVTGYPKWTVYLDRNDPTTGFAEHSLHEHYPENATPEEVQPRTYVGRRLLDVDDRGIEVALWPANELDPGSRRNTQSVAHHVILPYDRILAITLDDEQDNQQKGQDIL